MKKERIALNALMGAGGWTGGLYYIRNIAYMLASNSSIVNRYDIYLFAEAELNDYYKDLPSAVNIVKTNGFSNSKLKAAYIFVKYKIKYVFPIGRGIGSLFYKPIRWIPDFQHNYYPQLFEEKETLHRTELYSQYGIESIPVVLSSNSSKKDFYDNYKVCNQHVAVVPFVSYIEPMIRNLSIEREKSILDKHNLNGMAYACVMNQFWRHKNHIVVLNAMKLYYKKNLDSNFKFVFTGKLEDYRCPEYIEKLKTLFEDEIIKQHSVLLGFIDRDEQIAIMKNSEYVIQPSLFEGWGTVVEDAKVLDKTILLSDIPVHQEQKNGKCILFDPDNPQDLADLIEQENSKKHVDNIEEGIADMQVRAKEYSKAFQKLLDM